MAIEVTGRLPRDEGRIKVPFDFLMPGETVKGDRYTFLPLLGGNETYMVALCGNIRNEPIHEPREATGVCVFKVNGDQPLEPVLWMTIQEVS